MNCFYTMSDNTPHSRIILRNVRIQVLMDEKSFPALDTSHEVMVEPDGIEPTTSCLQSTRSPN